MSVLNDLGPEHIRPPFARYSHGIEVQAGSRLVFCSGQLGINPDDTIPEGEEEQAAICFENIKAILVEADMTPANIIRLNAYVTDRAFMAGYMKARDAFIAELDPPPASTLMIVGGFTREEFRVEIEAIAAAPAREAGI